MAPVGAGPPHGRTRLYYDLVENALPAATRRALEEKMKGYEYQGEFAKKYVAEGRAEGRAEGLLAVLRARDIAVPAASRERILAEGDPERLKRWLDKAVIATSLAEVLEEPS